MKAIVMLRDGTSFEGESFGASGEVCGEVVFNTAMTGYQEVLTDPSYRGQIVNMTFPLIGNYGINEEDFESRKLWLSGFIVREYSRSYSNWRGVESLENFLSRNGVIGVTEIDTRALTRKIRNLGAMGGIISTIDDNQESLLKKIAAFPEMSGRNYVIDVTTEKPWQWQENLLDRVHEFAAAEPEFHVVSMDYGIKFNIIRSLVSRQCSVTVIPADTEPDKILQRKPDGIVLSNGPGDPAALPEIIENIKKLLGKIPVMGICLGHQLLALALGGETFKLPFGHHGTNQPVLNLSTGGIELTSQNHGFAVNPDSLPTEVEVTHINLNDKTVEGIRHRRLLAYSIQYHPEASPGPRDSAYLFDNFIELMRQV